MTKEENSWREIGVRTLMMMIVVVAVIVVVVVVVVVKCKYYDNV